MDLPLRNRLSGIPSYLACRFCAIWWSAISWSRRVVLVGRALFDSSAALAAAALAAAAASSDTDEDDDDCCSLSKTLFLRFAILISFMMSCLFIISANRLSFAAINCLGDNEKAFLERV